MIKDDQVISIYRALLQARIFVNRTIGELLFDGYEDAVMKMADSFDNYEAKEYEAYDEFEFEDYEEESGDSDDEIVKSEKKEKAQVPMDKFGWFYKVLSVSQTEMILKYFGPNGPTASIFYGI